MAIEKSIRPHIKAVREPRDACQANSGITQSPATGIWEQPFESVTGFRGQGSAGMFGMCSRRSQLCRDAVVTVMQAADLWNGDNATS